MGAELEEEGGGISHRHISHKWTLQSKFSSYQGPPVIVEFRRTSTTTQKQFPTAQE